VFLLVVGVLLVAAAPTPAAAVTTLRTSSSASDAVLPLVALVALLAWSLLAWLTVLTAVVLARRLPGIAGRSAAAAARGMAPAAIRQLVEIALGLSVAAGVLAAGPASASPSIPPSPPAASATLDWPSAPTPAPAPASAPAPAPIAAPPASDLVPVGSVVVQPGDSLWHIAAAHLPADATARQVAQAWPAWWAANRDEVGANPDLIHPGQQLDPPLPS
jgi:LysM repeat protein